ncbi:hypothetical protein D8674_000404 [Pyrus ussuriensis x Pyrus communis]|uniref:Aminotransferase-like plant mobile domain-containing protein n=1 Tax=Pyrus ussuriensis x Pyrus communis TaxID=2448454 RepID=A0A5N5FGH9_9ROSA|nr:hypothetical protein D8674_000404 [Pyrus ussuriensis x Pyrus communis]
MAPKLCTACESGEGIVNLCHRLNDLHLLQVGLNLFIFFEKEEFTLNPYSIEARISASKLEAVHSFDDVATGPFIMAHLYHLLHEMTKVEPFETNINETIWILQFWLQWYCLEFWAANLEFPEGNTEEVGVGPENEAVDALVIQEATAKIARQKVGSSHAFGDAGDISELFSEPKAEAGPEVETRDSRRARVSVVESSKSELEERPQAQLALAGPRASKLSSAHPIEVGRKKQKAARPPATKKHALTPKETQSMHETTHQPTLAFREPIVSKIPVVSEFSPLAVSKDALPQPPKASRVIGIPITQTRKAAASAPESSSSIFVEAASAPTAFRGARVMPLPLAFILTMTSLPELVREFGQIKTKLRGFNEWMQRDFIASFSLKALQEVKKALTKLYKAQQMSKVQYE